MAELLVKATGHWMDKLTQAEVDKMTPEQKASYEARSQKGDIVVVRPDGWKWGREECLPRFIVVKTSETYEEAKKYEEPLTKQVTEKAPDGKDMLVQKIEKIRKYNIPTTEVEKVSLEVKDLEVITPILLKVPISVKSIVTEIA